jgi:hypothetical protein
VTFCKTCTGTNTDELLPPGNKVQCTVSLLRKPCLVFAQLIHLIALISFCTFILMAEISVFVLQLDLLLDLLVVALTRLALRELVLANKHTGCLVVV